MHPPRLLLALAAGALVVLTGCGGAGTTTAVNVTATEPASDAPSAPEETRSALPVVEMAGYVASGGLCTYGPCETSLSVNTDGTWSATTGEDATTGHLSEDQLDTLTRLVLATDTSPEAKPEVVCNAWTDGMDYALTFQPADGAQVNVSSCTHELADTDLLAALLDLHAPGDPIAM